MEQRKHLTIYFYTIPFFPRTLRSVGSRDRSFNQECYTDRIITEKGHGSYISWDGYKIYQILSRFTSLQPTGKAHWRSISYRVSTIRKFKRHQSVQWTFTQDNIIHVFTSALEYTFRPVSKPKLLDFLLLSFSNNLGYSRLDLFLYYQHMYSLAQREYTVKTYNV